MTLVNKPRRIGAQIVVYNEEDYLAAVLESVRLRVDRVLVMLNIGTPWFGEPVEPDRSEAIARKFADLYDNIEVVRGQWETEADERNEAMELLKDCEYVYVIDGDEILSAETYKNLIKSVMSYAPSTKAWYVNNYTFWKSPEFRIEPVEGFKPLVLAHQSVRFEFARIPQAGTSGYLLPIEKGVNHHFSYAHSDEKIKQKLANFSHADEIVPGWYEHVWKTWDNDSDIENLHPTNPPSYKKAIHHAMKPEISQLLKFNDEFKEDL